MSTGRTTLRGAPLVLAPGKLFLAGEYAVLEGGVAVVASVATYAMAEFLPGFEAESSVVHEAVSRARAALGDLAAAVPDGAPLVNTSRFVQDGVKLGLGSSAAAAVAAAGAVLEYAGVPLTTNKEMLFGVADAAHRAAQSGVGSGADVAAAVHGGFVRFVRLPGTAPIISQVVPPAQLQLVPFWTRGAASTADFIAGMLSFETRSGAAHARHLTGLRAAADRFAEAFASGHVRGIIQAADHYGQAMAELGKEAALPIVTAPFAAAAELARGLGGAAKPSGAGGGDMGLAFFASSDAAAAFRARCPDPLLVLDIGLGVPGAYRRLSGGVESFKKE